MTPFDGAIAAARTCYSPRVIATSEVTEPQRDLIGGLTFDAGHHTVYQHAHFEFGLENVSRQFVWAFLHSYPFYNSEQSSQRYVKLKEPRAFVPPLSGEALDVYESAVIRAWDRYAELSALLKDDAHAILKELRYVRPTTNPERLKQIDKDAEKRAIETARYVIPIGAFTSMVHTVSGIVLHRLYRMMNTGDTPHEARLVISEMVRLVKEWDPNFFEKVGPGPIASDDVPELSLPKPRSGGDRYAAEFDARLNGSWSRLRDASPDAEEIVAEAVRSVFGLTRDDMSDDEALDRVMNPARNRYRLDILNVSHHSPLMRALHHATYVFEKRLSHTADSQDQRHRMVPASRPLMTFSDTQLPDYITPRLIVANARAQAVYGESMREAWAAKNRLLELGVPLEFALYVLPNAKTLRFVESGSLLSLLHKWTLRTCFNAQEEIYLASMDEISAVRALHPRIGRHLGPPCVIRNGLISPRCTEGTHFCGVPVWKDFPAVVRRL
ncbi:MAG TPA: FAD-dependent thymidylate synthase [Vicinamibacterales bacterium]|jgi:thymidylate synthase ThyX|nr:FAD-dependent thymidylate synthase [Vicinamibacterales bacterium]